MPKVILHIGLEKTGTTSVQHFLSTHHVHLLAEHGLLYPTHPGLYHGEAHGALVSALVPARECDFVPPHAQSDVAFVMDGLEESLESKAETVVISSEHLSSRLGPAGIGELAQLLSSYPVEILAYVRRPDEMGIAAFSTHLKCGRRDWFIPGEISPKNRYYDYAGILKPWADVFGKSAIRVRTFDRGQMRNGDVIDDFLAAVGIDARIARETTPKLNASLNLAEAALLHLLNQYVPTWDEAAERGCPDDYHRAHQLRLRILKEAKAIPAMRNAPPLSSLLTAWDHQRIRRRFRKVTDSVARDYRDGQPLFESPPKMPSGERGRLVRPRPPLAEDQLSEILMTLAERLHESVEVTALPKRAPRLKTFLERTLLSPLVSSA